MATAYPFPLSPDLELHPAYAEARATPGLLRVRLPYGEPAWLATRYEDVRLVLGDRRFSRALAVTRDEPRTTQAPRPDGILSMDAPEHTRLRVLVAKAFTKRRVEDLRPSVRSITKELLANLHATGAPADLVEHFALPLPMRVICTMLGVPVEDQPRFKVWTDAMMSSSTLTTEEFRANQHHIATYMAGLIEAHRRNPADDLMTALIEARDQGDRLTETELIQMCVGLLVAGHETTATQIPNFIHVLLHHPAHLAALIADPDRIPAAVEELLRHVPLNIDGVLARYALEDIQVGDHLVRAGEAVIPAITAANRDPHRFPDPDTLHLTRETTQHLGFGHGVHHCLGAQLARVELQEALHTLLLGLPGLRLAGEVTWKSEMLVRGAARLPIAWDG